MEIAVTGFRLMPFHRIIQHAVQGKRLASIRQWARRAIWIFRDTSQRPEFHNRLIMLPGALFVHQGLGQLGEAPLPLRRVYRRIYRKHTGKHPVDISINNRKRPIPRKRDNCGGGIFTHAFQRQYLRICGREHSSDNTSSPHPPPPRPKRRHPGNASRND